MDRVIMKANNIDNMIWVKCTTTQFFLFLFFKCIGPSGFCFGFLIILFIYFWLCWVKPSTLLLGLFPSCGTRGLLSCSVRPSHRSDLSLESTGLVIGAHSLSCSETCEIFPDQGLNPCLLHWQADSSLLSHQGSPSICLSTG